MIGIAILNSKQHFQWTTQSNEIRLANGSDSLPGDVSLPLDRISLHISRNQQGVALRNFGSSLVLHAGPRLHRGAETIASLPLHTCIRDIQIEIFDPVKSHSLDGALTTLQTQSCDIEESFPVFGSAPSAATLASWFDSIGEIQRVAAGTQEFYLKLAQALFNPGGLDGGLLLLPDPNYAGGWRIEASFIPYPEFGISFRPELVRKAVESNASIFHNSQSIDQKASGGDEHAAVVCPVPGPGEAIEAVIYGFRSQHRTNNRRGIRALEAQFVQVLADSMSASLTRLQSEKDLARQNVLLKQAFAPEVAAELQKDRAILDGAIREVTVMFADLRGFSTLAERLGARMTYQLMNELMEHITHIIEDHDGVIIDYYGDGVSAFWNAPVKHPCHPLVACQSAMSLLQSLPEFNESWSQQIGHGLRMGIGIHTGVAMVGNSGSFRRIKYGPRGNTVNIAARLESATKQLHSSLLVSGDTARELDSLMKRRVCSTHLKGIQTPVEIWEVFDPSLFFERQSVFEEYSNALSAFEKGDFESSRAILQSLQHITPCDPVISFLLENANSRLQNVQEYKKMAGDIFPLISEELKKNQSELTSDRKSSSVKSPVEWPSLN